MIAAVVLVAVVVAHGFSPDAWEPTINTGLLIVLALLTTRKFRQHNGKVVVTMRKADKAAKDALTLRQDLEQVVKNIENLAANNGQVLPSAKT